MIMYPMVMHKDYHLSLLLQSANGFTDIYNERLLRTGHTTISTNKLAFDAMWTVAQVLNYTEEMRLQNLSKDASEFEDCAHLEGELVPLNEFTYSNAFMGCIMKNNYYKVNFTGVSVRHALMFFCGHFNYTCRVQLGMEEMVPYST